MANGLFVGLEAYRKKRDFKKTPEPSGEQTSESGRAFVIQKHDARRLHYDFRLELDGVLKSWAVPKGPSLDPSEKRLAVHVEDHPVEYASFEGLIPEGEYGGGPVIVWDRGVWIPEGDPRTAYEKGRLSFELEGQKLHGLWSLVRISKPRDKSNAWLLIKKRDAYATTGEDAEIVERKPESVLSDKTIAEVEREPERIWHSNKKRAFKKLPTISSPQLATLVEAPPKGPEWIYEVKLDGYRAIGLCESHEAAMISRNGKDWTSSMGTIARAIERLPVKSAVLDGEVVVQNDDGTTSFQKLQNALGEGRDDLLSYYVFDLLFLDGEDVAGLPLLERKKRLKTLLSGLKPSSPLRYGDHVTGDADKILHRVCELGGEGIVAKRADAPYAQKRTRDWVKVKCMRRQEVVIVGWTEPKGSRKGLGALVLAVHDDQGDLIDVGRVGTGFDQAMLAALHHRLKAIEQKASPLGKPTRGKSVHWARPELVAEVAFAEWTGEGKLRHPSFIALREDKDPSEVEREKPLPAAATKKKSADGRVLVLGVPITNPDKVLYADAGITKRELAEYYATAADEMLPHVANRPVMIYRCPDGLEGERWFQKHASKGMPEDVRTIGIEDRRGKSEPYLYIDSARGLVSLAQMGSLEIHVWGAHVDRLESPDLLVFDLDPDPAVEWKRVVAAAKRVRERLREHEMESFVRTTGGKGLHVVVELESSTFDWDKSRAFSGGIAAEMVREDPSGFVATMAKSKRTGKILIDYFRNTRGATSVASFSTRARKGAPVALPISWEELEAVSSGAEFDLRSVRQRLLERRDSKRRSLHRESKKAARTKPHK
jgi:bifunctional non-homologous end joining protein LigD